MALINKQNWDGFLGKSGGFVTYLLGDLVVRRAIGITTKAPTEKQLSQRLKAILSNNLNKPVKEFINIGFKSLAKQLGKVPHALMSSNTLSNAITGVYPNLQINYSKVLFSKGTMPITPDLSVTLKGAELHFEWNTASKPGEFRADDQAMIMVYLPDQKDALYTVSAADRATGRAVFPMLNDEQATVMEIYISFISANHERVSDSAYLGQIILPAMANNQLTLWQ